MAGESLSDAVGLLEAFKVKYAELIKSVNYNVYAVEYKNSLKSLSRDFLYRAIDIVNRYLVVFVKMKRWNNISSDEKKKIEDFYSILNTAVSKMSVNLETKADCKPIKDAIELLSHVAQNWPDLKAGLVKKILPIQVQEIASIV